MEIHCPNCRESFQASVWENGQCSGCNEPYSWDCGYSFDEGDEYFFVIWDNY